MKKPKADMYITMLKIGRACGASGKFMRQNVIVHLQKTGHLTDADIELFEKEKGKQVSERCPKYRMIDHLMKAAYKSGTNGIISVDAYFQLLEWEELKGARKTAPVLNELRHSLRHSFTTPWSPGTLPTFAGITYS